MSEAQAQRELQVRLERSFAAHVAALCERSAHALAACGFRGLLVYAGSPLPVFEDDRNYPFVTNAPFKVWAPLEDAPGSFVWFEPGARPRLILERPQDYWYKPVELPQGYWVRHFDIRTAADRAAARALLPADLSGAAYIGDAFAELAAWGVGAVNPPAADAPAGLWPRREVAPTSSSACARRAAWECSGTAPRSRRSAPGFPSSRSSWRSSGRAGCASRNCLTIRSSRSMRAVPCCTTRCWRSSARASGSRCSSTPAPGSPAMPATSRAPTARQMPSSRRSSAAWTACSRRYAPRCVRGSTGGKCTCSRIASAASCCARRTSSAAASRKPWRAA